MSRVGSDVPMADCCSAATAMRQIITDLTRQCDQARDIAAALEAENAKLRADIEIAFTACVEEFVLDRAEFDCIYEIFVPLRKDTILARGEL